MIEVAAVVGKDGAVPLAVPPLEPSMRALLQRAKAYEELTIQAAVTRDRGAALRALITNPLGPGADAAVEVLDDLLATNGLTYH